MRRMFATAGAALLASAVLAGPVMSQGTPQTVSLVRVDTTKLSTGWRTSKIVGAKVVNEANETIGKVDDLLLTPNDKVPFAILSVGGFLGMGKHLVVVPYDALKIDGKQMMLPGATKEALKALPEFKYAKS